MLPTRTMKLSYLLDDYVSPKILGGPYASAASGPAIQALRDDPDYQELRRRLMQEGFFKRAPLNYAWRMVVLVGLYGALFAYLLTGPDLAPRLIACLILGLVHTQSNFLSHDILHGAVITARSGTDLAGQIYNTLLTGFSFSYFRRSHTLHHYHCNEAGFDPDTISVMWSVSPYEARRKRGLGRVTTHLQHVLIPFLYTLWAFSLKVEGIKYVLRNPRNAAPDLLMLALHLGLWFGVGGHYIGLQDQVVNYGIMTVTVGIYLGVIFPVNHVGTAILNADTGARVRFLEHHLFPWVPSMRLAAARPIVRSFCNERGLPYQESPHWVSYTQVMGHLRDVARQSSGQAPRPVEP